MRLMRLAAFMVIPALVACGQADEPEAPEPNIKAHASVNVLLDDQVGRLSALLPVTATYNSIPAVLTGGPVNDKLPDYSPAGEEARRALMALFIEEIDAIDKSGMGEQELLSLNTARVIYQDMSRSARFSYGRQSPLGFTGHTPYPANQLSGPLVDVPNTLVSQQSVNTTADADAYIARLKAFTPSFASLVAKIEADAEIGAILPQVLIDRTLAVIEGFTSIPVAENALFTSFADKLDAAGIDNTDYLQAAAEAIESDVYPAFTRVGTTLAGLRDQAPGDAGVWQQPEGAAFYAEQIRSLGDSNLTADAIHQLGLDEVARITGEMDMILQAQGYSDGTVGERMNALGKEERFLYPDTDEGREAVLQLLRDQTAEILELAPQYFERTPPQALEVRRIPIFSQDSAPGGYYDAPSLDGTRPGIYWINLRNMANVPSFSLNTLTYHEAVPGHHFQIATAMSIPNLPIIRKLAPFNAFVEGWALYSERLAKEMGLYDDDPFGDLGRLQDELFRAVRLVVDTGLHHKQWTREQAIDYMAATTGNTRDAVRSEIERYMAWPGQALGYKLGQLRLLALRKKAREALDGTFDIRGFHSLLLESGQLPFAVVQQRVSDWINAQGTGE